MHSCSHVVLFLLINILLLSSTVRAGENVYHSVVFKSLSQKIETPIHMAPIPGARMKRVGMGMTIAGVTCLGIGAALIGTANWQRVNTAAGPSFATRDIKGALGVLLCLPGIGLTIPGGIVWGLGERKIKRYRENISKQVAPIILEKKDSDKIPVQERF